MRITSLLLVITLFACLSCSDDETKTPIRGTMTIDGEIYDLHQLYGQAEVGSDFSYYSFVVYNSNGKMNDSEELTGKNINGMRFDFYRMEATNEPVTGTYYNSDEEEHYEMDADVVIGYNASNDTGSFLEDFTFAEVVISKTGSNYKLVFEGETDDGVEVRMTYEGPLKKLSDEEFL